MKLACSEKQLTLAVLHYLKAVGAVAGKIKSFGYKHRKFGYIKDYWQWTGIPDVLCFYKHRHIYFECKRDEHCKQSDDQKRFEELCKEANVEYYVIRSIDDVKDAIINNKKGGQYASCKSYCN